MRHSENIPEEAGKHRDWDALVLDRLGASRGAGDVETAAGTRGAKSTRMLGTLRGAVAAERRESGTSLKQSRRHDYSDTTDRELRREPRCCGDEALTENDEVVARFYALSASDKKSALCVISHQSCRLRLPLLCLPLLCSSHPTRFRYRYPLHLHRPRRPR